MERQLIADQLNIGVRIPSLAPEYMRRAFRGIQAIRRLPVKQLSVGLNPTLGAIITIVHIRMFYEN